MQSSCKHQKVFRGTCSVPANSKKFFEALAAFLQGRFSSFWCLQKFCKKHFHIQNDLSIPSHLLEEKVFERASPKKDEGAAPPYVETAPFSQRRNLEAIRYAVAVAAVAPAALSDLRCWIS